MLRGNEAAARRHKDACSDPSFESDPTNEYSLLWLTHVMNLIFLDPGDEFLTQVVNIGIPKHVLGFCFHVSKRGYKIGYELTRKVDHTLYCARFLRRLAEPEEFQIGHDRSHKDGLTGRIPHRLRIFKRGNKRSLTNPRP